MGVAKVKHILFLFFHLESLIAVHNVSDLEGLKYIIPIIRTQPEQAAVLAFL